MSNITTFVKRIQNFNNKPKSRKFKEISNQISNYINSKLLEDKKKLEINLREAGNGDIYDVDPLKMPVEAGGNLWWDFMDPTERSKIIGGMLRHQISRAYKEMSVYSILLGDSIKNVDTSYIEKIEDLLQLPFITKDHIESDGVKQTSFRELSIADRNILIPKDMQDVIKRMIHRHENSKLLQRCYDGIPIWHFHSGGSKGGKTWTALSYLDLETESYALAFRALLKGGFYPGAKFLSLYNETHKGGFNLKRASELLGVEYHSKRMMSNYLANKYGKEWIYREKRFGDKLATPDDITYIGEKICEYISDHKIEIIASVQPSREFLAKNDKGGMITFENIYDNKKPNSFDSVYLVFITGFPVPKETYEKLRNDGIEVFTTWGATESMANGTHPLIHDSFPSINLVSSNVNDLVDIIYPNIWIPVVYNRNQRRWERSRVGEPGYIVVTNIFRVGTIYSNFNIEDIGTRTIYGLKDIHKKNVIVALEGTCASDAMEL